MNQDAGTLQPECLSDCVETEASDRLVLHPKIKRRHEIFFKKKIERFKVFETYLHPRTSRFWCTSSDIVLNSCPADEAGSSQQVDIYTRPGQWTPVGT